MTSHPNYTVIRFGSKKRSIISKKYTYKKPSYSYYQNIEMSSFFLHLESSIISKFVDD